jgi:hypothetical protein
MAVLLLELEKGPLQERLAPAYTEAIDRIHTRDVPPPLRTRLVSVHNALAAQDVMARAVDDGWTGQIATEVVERYAAVVRTAEGEMAQAATQFLTV